MHFRLCVCAIPEVSSEEKMGTGFVFWTYVVGSGTFYISDGIENGVSWQWLWT